MCVHMCVRMHLGMCMRLQKPDKSTESFDAGIRGGCQPLDVGAGNRTAILCKLKEQRMLLLLSHLLCPHPLPFQIKYCDISSTVLSAKDCFHYLGPFVLLCEFYFFQVL